MPPRPRSASRSARELVESHLENQPDSNVQPAPEADSQDSEILTGLYDYQPGDVRSRETVTGPRKSIPTPRNKEYRKNFHQDEAKRLRTNETRATNRAQRGRAKKPKKGRRGGKPSQAEGPSSVQRGRPTAVRDISRSPTPGSTDCDTENPEQGGQQPAPASRSRKLPISRPPSRGSTDYEPNQATQANTQSQFTYVDGTLDHDGLVRYAQELFGVDSQGCHTQAILDKIRLAQAQQAADNGPARRPPSIVMHSSNPIRVGRGWSQKVVPRQPVAPLTGKRTRDEVDGGLGGTSKRQCIVSAEDTATESETDDEPVSRNGGRSYIDRSHPPDVVDPPRPGTAAPSLRRQPTASTVIDIRSSTPPSRSHSLGGSLPFYGEPRSPSPVHSELPRSGPPSEPKVLSEDLLPSLLTPTRGPVHARLRGKLLTRYFDAVDREAQAVEDMSSSEEDPLEEVPETEPDSSSDEIQRTTGLTTCGPTRPQRTYAHTKRSHLPSRSDANPASTSANTNANTHLDDTDHAEVNRPNSPRLSASQLIRRERARAAAAKAHDEMKRLATSRKDRRPGILASAKAPPSTRPQTRPPPGGKGGAIGRRDGGTRRLDPVSAARADMLAFNKAVARGEATSLVQSVTRQSQKTARCAPPKSRPADGLLEDDEEMLAQAEAYAKSRWPTPYSSRSRRRVRKQKPLARDISGIERQVLIMAKVHLFAYALVEGVYQTRATYIRWSSAVHVATWQMELPGRPYEKPLDEVFEILVNNIATLRGKVKERLREFIANVIGFQQSLTNQQTILENLAKFDEVYPNTFHCRDYNPRYHYEHPEIGHCIALAFFHGPGSVGVMYPDYFRDMPITVVAFALAMWQFCIEEWANGWRQNGDLGMAAMREKYEAQLAGLKALRDAAPRRLSRLQAEWRDYVAEYSGAIFVPDTEFNAEPPRPFNIRPDTPEPDQDDAISVEEMNDRLFEAGRQASLRDRLEAIAARELEEPMDIESRAASPRPGSPSPSVEFNEFGVMTGRSKGKDRAN